MNYKRIYRARHKAIKLCTTTAIARAARIQAQLGWGQGK